MDLNGIQIQVDRLQKTTTATTTKTTKYPGTEQVNI